MDTPFPVYSSSSSETQHPCEFPLICFSHLHSVSPFSSRCCAVTWRSAIRMRSCLPLCGCRQRVATMTRHATRRRCVSLLQHGTEAGTEIWIKVVSEMCLKVYFNCISFGIPHGISFGMSLGISFGISLGISIVSQLYFNCI